MNFDNLAGLLLGNHILKVSKIVLQKVGFKEALTLAAIQDKEFYDEPIKISTQEIEHICNINDKNYKSWESVEVLTNLGIIMHLEEPIFYGDRIEYTLKINEKTLYELMEEEK